MPRTTPLKLLITATTLLAAPAALAQTGGEARDLALEALRLEFERDNVSATADELATRFATACERGYNPACRRSTWLDEDMRPDPSKTREIFQPSCDAGDPVACVVVGWSLDALAPGERNDDDRDRVWRSAARLYKTHCDEGFQLACHDYAAILYENKGVESDPRPALARWKKACDLSEWASCTRLARLYTEGGRGVTPSASTARSYAKKACDGGYPDGCFLHGELEGADWPPEKLDEFFGGLCEQGHEDSCWRLARTYFDGIHPEPSEGRILALFDRACQLGHARGCFEAGRWQQDSGGEDARSADLFGRACDLGDAAGCSAQVDLILSGRVEGTVRDAFDAFDLACEHHQSIGACTELAYALIEGVSVPRDAERGRSLLLRSCTNQGSDPQACFVLGKAFEEGIGGERDRTEASKYYRWACTAGNVEACVRRGELLTSDVGVRRDDLEALAMFQRGCEGDYGTACFLAGRIVDEGTNVRQDLPLAIQLYEAGCSLGEHRGCYALGAVHERGVSGTPDMAAARGAYERALEAGSLDAKRALARLLWSGYGGKRDKGRAKELCRDACQAGDAVACRGPAFL